MSQLTAEEKKQSDDAIAFIKKHQKAFLDKFAGSAFYVADAAPVSLFMAGSPGAGKTETSKRLIETFSNKPVRIDADEIREFLPGYNGTNAYIFQRAADKGINILLDHTLANNINFILDATFAYGGYEENVARCLNHKRKVVIYYIFQEPKKAWEMVIAREAIEHRRVSKDVFVSAFLAARNNVNMIKHKFGSKIELNIIIKNFDTGEDKIELGISTVDDYLPKAYTQDELNIITL
ncbi:MAG: zeta toxin family protein [bacterium]|nr:zeta toxin family protein [bacterium]